MKPFDKLLAAGELTDLPGHCKLCGNKVETEDHPMQDPAGILSPIYFCSATCLDEASNIFSSLTPEQTRKAEELISQAERKNAIIH